MCEKFNNKFVIQNHMQYPNFILNQRNALNVSEYGSIVVAGRFDGGEVGACYNNSLRHCFEKRQTHSMEYCLGFACGQNNNYRPHAWVRCDGIYTEVSPQEDNDSRLTDYILCHRMTIKEIISILNRNNINNVVAPMIDQRGMIIISNV